MIPESEARGSGATLRPERGGDTASLHALHVACFEGDEEARLVDALRAGGNLRLSLVAEVDGELASHAAFSPATLEGAEEGLGLGPVATLEGQRRRGLAAALVRLGLERCRAAGAPWVVVLGDPAYYGRFGFEPAGGRGLDCVFGGGDAFQVLELVGGALPEAGGRVHYAPEFEALGG